jgi:L-ascorbate metabolism protein UlaG (beta-lactamase superfamily)
VSRVRRWGLIALTVVVAVPLLVVLVTVVVGYALSAPGWRGAVSDHFDGRRFRDLRPVPHGGLGAFLRWQRTRRRTPWQDRHPPPGPPPPPRVSDGRMRVTVINHATTLIQQDGVNVLCDPIWSERASPFSWIGPRRHGPPGVRFEDLPPLDAVVVSHNHYDHLDLPTLRRLAAAGHPRFFVAVGNRALLERAGVGPVTELDWWQSARLSPSVEIWAVPAQHFSSRGLFDRDRTLWAGWAVRGPAGLAYFAGDSGDGPHYRLIRERLGAPRLAVLPIGAYQPAWFMSGVHQSPAEALAAARTLGARVSVGMHYGTFALADDGQDEPPAALTAAAAAMPEAPTFWVLPFGEGRDVP